MPAVEERPSKEPEAGELPGLLFAQASPKSVGGSSLLEAAELVDEETVDQFRSESQVVEAAVAKLKESGFEILQVSDTTINIAGPPSLFEEVFATHLETELREVVKPGARRDVATFVECPDTGVPGLIATGDSPLDDVLEGVAIERPVYYHESAFAPLQDYWHLRVPGDVSLGLNAERAHRDGLTGRGVEVVMVDSGWYAHPYFIERGYKASAAVLGPGAVNPAADESGHGTGESANVFAAAPDVDFTLVKMNFTNSTGAFNAAVALAPQVISCSWGSDVEHGPLSASDQALAAAVAAAVLSGIVVVVSAGNGQWGFPGQHPDVISAGGVYVESDGSMVASDYASGFASNVFPGRNVPDVSGLVGMQPGATYIMLPVQPGDEIDRRKAGGVHPPQDQTAGDDGWAAFSGTSAAAPQIAGVCALLRQARPELAPADVRRLLAESAIDVTAGASWHGNPAAVGPDLATGAGLVDAHAAVQLALQA